MTRAAAPEVSWPAVLLAAGASGAGLWLAGPRAGLWPLAWVALVPLALVALRGGPRAAAAVALGYGLYLELLLVGDLPFGIAEGQWGDAVIPLPGDSPVLPVALLAVPAAAALLGAAGLGRPGPARHLPGVLGPLACVAVPAAGWTALDAAHLGLSPGSWWGPLGLGQHAAPTAGLAAWAGPVALTTAIVAVNYAIALAVLRRTRGAAAAAAGVIAAVALAGVLAPAPSGGPPLRAAVLQPGYDTAEPEPIALALARREHREASWLVAEDLERLTRAAADGGARLVVWPEAAIWVDPQAAGPLTARLEGLARETGAVLLLPFFLPQPRASGAVAVTPDGRWGERRFKRRPMWYLGERTLAEGAPRPLEAAGARLGLLFGVDNESPWLARRLVAEGAEILVAVTHDWRELAAGQLALSRLHARATGRPLLRADWRFGSAVVAPDGVLRGTAGGDRARTVLVTTVARPAGRTPFARTGDLVTPAAVALTAAAALAGLVRRRRYR